MIKQSLSRYIHILILLYLSIANSGCSTAYITPQTGEIKKGRIKDIDLHNIQIAVINRTRKEVFKDSVPLDTTYAVDFIIFSDEYVRALKGEIIKLGGTVNQNANRRLTVEVADINYLGAVSLSFNASAWAKLYIVPGENKRIRLKPGYTTPRSFSLRGTFIQQAFDGLVREAVIDTLNNETIRAYLLSGQ